MAAASGRGMRPGGVVRAVGRLGLLVGLGFLSGLLIGVLSEEPELVVGHLRGESESVVLLPTDGKATEGSALATGAENGGRLAGNAPAEPRSGLAKGDSEAVPKAASAVEAEERASAARLALLEVREREAAMRARPEERPTAGLPVVSAAKTDASDANREWAIQVGAFTDEKAAQRLLDTLRDRGYPTKLLTEKGGAQRWRVRVQPVLGKDRATAMSERLKRVEGLPTWMLPMEERSGR